MYDDKHFRKSENFEEYEKLLDIHMYLHQRTDNSVKSIR